MVSPRPGGISRIDPGPSGRTAPLFCPGSGTGGGDPNGKLAAPSVGPGPMRGGPLPCCSTAGHRPVEVRRNPVWLPPFRFNTVGGRSGAPTTQPRQRRPGGGPQRFRTTTIQRPWPPVELRAPVPRSRRQLEGSRNGPSKRLVDDPSKGWPAPLSAPAALHLLPPAINAMQAAGSGHSPRRFFRIRLPGNTPGPP